MMLLRDRDQRLSMNDTERKGSYFFQTYLMHACVENIDGRNDKQIKTMTRGIDLSQYESIFIPVNIDNLHWTLIVIKLDLKEIHCYDSIVIDYAIQYIHTHAHTHTHTQKYVRTQQIPS